MMIPKPLLLVLSALYRLNRSDLPVNVTTLALTMGARRAVVANRLSELHDLGLVDAHRLSLTMTGLAVAVAGLAPARAVADGGLRLAAWRDSKQRRRERPSRLLVFPAPLAVPRDVETLTSVA